MGPRRGFAAALATVVVALALLLAARSASGGAAPPAQGDDACFACHDAPFATKLLESGERLPLFVDRAAFAASVHAKGGCAGCHRDVDAAKHPSGKAIPGRRQYAGKRSAACRACHAPPQRQDPSVHTYLVQKTDAPPCSVCHPPHALRPLGEWREATSEARYCLSCHFRDIQVSFPSDETVIRAAGGAAVWPSIHLTHECRDCHIGFSKQAHPVRMFASRREHAEKLAQGCPSCHPKQQRLTEGSIHAGEARPGGRPLPICTDCHGSHDVPPKATFEVLAGVPCRKCHQAIFDAFGGSVHGQALARAGHTSAPLCSDCHHAHGVASLALREQMSRACLGCHADTGSRHARWLPSAGQHLAAVTCPACHVPAARRRVDINFFDQRRKEQVSLDEVRRLLGPELARRFDEMEEGTESVGVWAILRELNRRGAAENRKFVIQVDALSGAEAHRIGSKATALRECAECHRGDRKKLEELFLGR